MTSLRFLFLTLLASCALAQRLGDWRPLAKEGSLYKLARSKYPFNPWGNMRHCRKRIIWIRAGLTSDYTELINSKLQVLKRKGGGTVRLTRGTFMHSGNIEIPSYTCLVGAGMSKTVLKLKNRSPRFKYSGNVRSFQTERVSIIDLTIDGNRRKQKTGKTDNYGRYGVFTELTNYLLIRNVRVANHAGYGFDPHGSKRHWAYYLIVENCRADNNGLDGFTIDQTVHATILGGVSSLNDRHGYNVVTGTRLAVFRDCKAVNNGKGSGVGYGYVAQGNMGYGTRLLTFERVSSNDDHRGGLRLRDVNNIYVEDSTFSSQSSGVCYEISGTYTVFLRRNTCAVRKNRKIKKGKGAFFTEESPRDAFKNTRTLPAKSLPIPRGNASPSCAAGIWASNICCDARCRRCATRGCGAKQYGPGSARCCVGSIRKAARPCSTFGPPCIMATFRK